MICKSCGKENAEGVKFCTECGTEMIQEVVATQETKKSEATKNDFVAMLMSSIMDLKNYLLKPLASAKEEKTEDIKNVAITGVILTLAMTLINLVKSMFNAVRVVSYDWLGGSSTSWEFSNLGDLNYIELIFKNFFIYAIVMLAIALIFFIGTLIIKKQVKYPKLLSFVYIAAVPFALGNMLVAYILGFLYSPLGVIATIISSIYSLTIFYELVNEELQLKDEIKIYFNAACFSTILVIIYFIIVKVVLAAISSVTNIFGGF